MSLLKGIQKDGFIEISRAVKFMKAAHSLPALIWSNPWYVDYDAASDGWNGGSESTPKKYLQSALTSMAAGDTVFIKPRTPDYAGGDPQAIIPASTTNWTLAYGKYRANIIGTGAGVGRAGNRQVVLQAASGASATPTLKISACDVNLENLTFRRGGSTVAGLQISSIADYYVYGVTVNNCAFWKIGATATSGALDIESAWHCVVSNSQFEQCAKGIHVGTSVSEVDGLAVLDTKFLGPASTIDVDIYCAGDVDNILIDRCLFAHDIPALAGGSVAKYIVVGATSTGLWSNSVIGSETAAIATNATVGNIDIANVTYAPGTNFTS